MQRIASVPISVYLLSATSLALEKLVPAKGPAEKMSGFWGESGSTLAAPMSSSVFAMR